MEELDRARMSEWEEINLRFLAGEQLLQPHPSNEADLWLGQTLDKPLKSGSQETENTAEGIEKGENHGAE